MSSSEQNRHQEKDEVNNLWYYKLLADGTAEITGFFGGRQNMDVTVPSKLNGLRAASIG